MHLSKNCQGDSGGPLSVKDPVTKKHELVGVSSFVFSAEDKKVTYFEGEIANNIILTS